MPTGNEGGSAAAGAEGQGAAAAAGDAAAAGRVSLGGGGEAGNPQPNPPTPTAGDGAGASADWAGPEEGNRSLVSSKGWKSPADALAAYGQLEAKLGGALTVPGENATEADWAAFHKKAGAPEKADDYPQLSMPEGLPEGMPYDQAFAQGVKVKAAELGLTARQLDGLHAWYVQNFAGQWTGAVEQQGKLADKAFADLTKDWGAPETAGFQRNQEMANRAIKNLGGDALLSELKQVGVLNAHGDVLAPQLVKALAKAGGAMFAEDTMFGTAATTEKNPFAKATEDRTRISELVAQARKDPRMLSYTVALIKGAGQDPAEYGFPGR